MEKEIQFNINVPEGYEIDKDNSTFECIKLKPIKKKFPFGDDPKSEAGGYCVMEDGTIFYHACLPVNKPKGWCFSTEAEAKSVLAAARISQILEHDDRFGGKITDEEWGDCKVKYVIFRYENDASTTAVVGNYYFLAFHTEEQRNLFMDCYPDLIRQYLMIK